MCGRYQLTTPWDELVEGFDVAIPTFDDWPARWNIAPTQEAPAIIAGDQGERRLGLLRWGLIPSWAKQPSIGNRMINARSETAAEKPAFRAAFARRRCLIPMSGFYEWRKDESTKTPFLIRAASRDPFSVAGLWERWDDPAGERVHTFTILTTEASGWMGGLHDRMPVLLDGERAERWLAADAPRDELQGLLVSAPDDALEACEVSPAVNAPRNDRPEVSEPIPGGEYLAPGAPGAS